MLLKRVEATRGHYHGFTLVELLAAITIVGLLLAVAVPSSMRFYDSIQYRQSVRDVITLLGSARYLAVNSGEAQDVIVNPRVRTVRLNEESRTLPKGMNIVVHSASELNRGEQGVIRFYPEGGSSGGDLDVERAGSHGVRISVDWLVGSISQEKYALN